PAAKAIAECTAEPELVTQLLDFDLVAGFSLHRDLTHAMFCDIVFNARILGVGDSSERQKGDSGEGNRGVHGCRFWNYCREIPYGFKSFLHRRPVAYLIG